jgi:hypothetical protein
MHGVECSYIYRDAGEWQDQKASKKTNGSSKLDNPETPTTGRQKYSISIETVRKT